MLYQGFEIWVDGVKLRVVTIAARVLFPTFGHMRHELIESLSRSSVVCLFELASQFRERIRVRIRDICEGQIFFALSITKERTKISCVYDRAFDDRIANVAIR